MLDVALELFAVHGFDGTSLQQIADRLGVTKAAVYYHFRSKDDLLAAVVEPAFDELQAVLAAAEAVPNEANRAKVALSAFADYLVRHRSTAAYMSRDAPAMTRPVVLDRSRDIERRLVDLLTVGESTAVSRLWSRAILQAVSGAVLSDPEADEAWLRAEVAEISAHLFAGYRSARRRALETEAP